ncbi:hypothetical protein HGH93_07485 [Chitinophaga polysaccharea]|uniref:hypothetical protein n=1 Tax=Chitinophaga TaxID=79328 RepID=UPI0014557E88|nr:MULTISPECIES: hypothetical protein [Chitinophaga]NLR57937.1 hypothetical protein [Chitinophaga polysaccharea]NLU93530.1 hypothetical protein [Chitinophaga sp. Ak27]
MKLLVWSPILLLLSCHSSQKIYQAPAVGAEAQFDRGLRPEKHPRYLFDKKTMKDMQQRGTASGYSSKRRSSAPTIPLPGKDGNGKDSSTAVNDSTALPLPADSTQVPASPTDTSRHGLSGHIN